MARLVDAASKLASMAASVASLRDGAIASTAAANDALGMVRRTGTSAGAGGCAGASCPAGGTGARMWISTASGTPLFNSRGNGPAPPAH